VSAPEDDALDSLDRLVANDPRYPRDAYVFVFQALEFVVGRLEKRRHVSGRELLEGIREFALERYGLMTKTVFAQWGITRTEDFGEIVFRLVGAGLLSKTEEDSIDDFGGVYDFEEAFVRDYPWERARWEI
jgi:uncharacterized repeat protein (TIGR04138 family)